MDQALESLTRAVKAGREGAGIDSHEVDDGGDVPEEDY